MSVVSGFPFLTDQEFIEACEELERGSDYKLYTDSFVPTLRYTKYLPLPDRDSAISDAIDNRRTEYEHDQDDTASDTDEEALPKNGKKESTFSIVYHVLLSASYRVPVVYLQPRCTSGGPAPLSLSQLYEAVVPGAHRSAVEAAGIYGALSMTEHPATGLPAYFVHPCRTADALRASCAGDQVSPVEYLMLWFGIIGTSVGLSVPMRVALSTRESE